MKINAVWVFFPLSIKAALSFFLSEIPGFGPEQVARGRAPPAAACEGGREGEEGREGRRAGGGGCGGQGFPPWAGGGCPASGTVRSGGTGNEGFPRRDWTKPKVPSLGARGLCLRSWQERR